jgi:hypothetical protein
MKKNKKSAKKMTRQAPETNRGRPRKEFKIMNV